MLYQHVHSAGFYYDWYKGDLMFQVICQDGLGRVVRPDLHSIIVDGVPGHTLPQDVVTRALI